MGDAGIMTGVEASPVDYDIIVIGAGISGINAAYRIQERCPDKSYAILEARGSMGGTWDLFKYPGIRSDSDLHTFGFPWRPWTSEKTIAEAHLIKQYMIESAEEYGIDKKIIYHHRVLSANWSTPAQAWSLRVDANGEQKVVTCRFYLIATGYYDYQNPLEAKIPGIENFQGTIVHPQFWPEDLDYANKDVAIIGSGATAVTLLPNLAEKASHVTMVQRSPGYVMSLPQVDKLAEATKWFLPKSWALKLTRFRYIVLPFLFFKFCRAYPGVARNILTRGAKRQLPSRIPIKPHFDPAYNPWEQRLCVCPSGDFYKALKGGKGDIVTGHIDHVTEKSIVMKDSSTVLHPDIIVTATGLKIQIAGGAIASVDGEVVHINEKHLWKGALIQDVPNVGVVIGYTNASWTLGADATAQQFTRIINDMKKRGKTSFTPTLDPNNKMESVPVLNLNSTYVLKAEGELPRAGNKAPWLPRSTYMSDIWQAGHGDIHEGLKYR